MRRVAGLGFRVILLSQGRVAEREVDFALEEALEDDLRELGVMKHCASVPQAPDCGLSDLGLAEAALVFHATENLRGVVCPA
jgi:hypothetical protein